MATTNRGLLDIHRKHRMVAFAKEHNLLPAPRGFKEDAPQFGRPAQKFLKRIEKFLNIPQHPNWNDAVQNKLFPVSVAKSPHEWALWYVAYQEHTHSMHYDELRPMHLVKPPEVYHGGMDCSWFVTQLYYDSGWPDPNDFGYNGSGNTSSLRAHGELVPVHLALPDDLAFYADPEHVTCCIGNNKVVSMGTQGDPSVEYLVGNYRPVQEVRRYRRK